MQHSSKSALGDPTPGFPSGGKEPTGFLSQPLLTRVWVSPGWSEELLTWKENQASLANPKQLGIMVSPRCWKGQGLMPELTSGDHAIKLCIVGCTVALMETCL